MYHLLDPPLELYTLIFAVVWVAGRSSHHIERLINMGKIIRPAYANVGGQNQYIPIEER